jgi:hypothetical protein
MAELMQPNIVGNFLNAYQSGLERQEAQKEAERQRMRQDRADQRSDQQFQWQMDDRQLQEAMRRKDTLARAAMALNTPEKWAAGAAQVMRELGMDGEVPGFDQRDRIISESMSIGDQLEQQWKERGYKLDEIRTNAQVRASNANAAQSYAAAAASMRGGGGPNAPSGYNYSPDGSRLVAIPGGPGDPARLQPGELSKIRNSNKQIDELENSLKAYTTALGKTTSGGRLLTRGAEVSSVETMHTDLLMQMKNLYELGVLNGPDYMLMTKIVEDPTGVMQMARGTKGLNAQLGTVQSIINRARNINDDRLQQAGVDAYRNPPAQGAATGKPNPAVAGKTSGWSVNKVGN